MLSRRCSPSWRAAAPAGLRPRQQRARNPASVPRSPTSAQPRKQAWTGRSLRRSGRSSATTDARCCPAADPSGRQLGGRRRVRCSSSPPPGARRDTRNLPAAGPPTTSDALGYASDGDGDGLADIWSIDDAALAAARLLHANGAPLDYQQALYAYNHSAAYVTRVLRIAETYRADSTGTIRHRLTRRHGHSATSGRRMSGAATTPRPSSQLGSGKPAPTVALMVESGSSTARVSSRGRTPKRVASGSAARRASNGRSPARHPVLRVDTAHRRRLASRRHRLLRRARPRRPRPHPNDLHRSTTDRRRRAHRAVLRSRPAVRLRPLSPTGPRSQRHQ